MERPIQGFFLARDCVRLVSQALDWKGSFRHASAQQHTRAHFYLWLLIGEAHSLLIGEGSFRHASALCALFDEHIILFGSMIDQAHSGMFLRCGRSLTRA